MSDKASVPTVAVVFMIAVTIVLAGFAFTDVQEKLEVSEPPDARFEAHGSDTNDNGDIDTIKVKMLAFSEESGNITAIIESQNRQEKFQVLNWTIGETQRIPCYEKGPHHISLAYRNNQVGSFSLHCGESLYQWDKDKQKHSHDVDWTPKEECVHELLDHRQEFQDREIVLRICLNLSDIS